MNLAVIERDRILEQLNDEQRTYIEKARDQKTKQLWVQMLCQVRGIDVPEEAHYEGLIETLNEFVYSHMLMGPPGTTPFKCQKCGRNLRYQYHLKHSESGVVMKLGIECFKHVMNVDSQLDWDLQKEINKGEQLFMDYLVAFRDTELVRHQPILMMEDAPQIYKEQIELGLPLTKKQEYDFERWYQMYIYEKEMEEYEAFKRDIFNDEQLAYVNSLSKMKEERLMRQRINDYAMIPYDKLKDLDMGDDAKTRARLGLPLSNRQLSKYNRLKEEENNDI